MFQNGQKYSIYTSLGELLSLDKTEKWNRYLILILLTMFMNKYMPQILGKEFKL